MVEGVEVDLADLPGHGHGQAQDHIQDQDHTLIHGQSRGLLI